jgi:Na+-driven multidrug efflux pump
MGPLANHGANLSFPMAYFIFFLSDIPRGIIFEICFYKMNWAHSITQKITQRDDSLARDDIQIVEKETFTK